jgi:hypothetical protein
MVICRFIFISVRSYFIRLTYTSYDVIIYVPSFSILQMHVNIMIKFFIHIYLKREYFLVFFSNWIEGKNTEIEVEISDRNKSFERVNDNVDRLKMST